MWEVRVSACALVMVVPRYAHNTNKYLTEERERIEITNSDLRRAKIQQTLPMLPTLSLHNKKEWISSFFYWVFLLFWEASDYFVDYGQHLARIRIQANTRQMSTQACCSGRSSWSAQTQCLSIYISISVFLQWTVWISICWQLALENTTKSTTATETKTKPKPKKNVQND